MSIPRDPTLEDDEEDDSICESSPDRRHRYEVVDWPGLRDGRALCVYCGHDGDG